MSELRPLGQPSLHGHIIEATHRAHDRVRAMYDQVSEYKSDISKVRGEMDKLMKLGDIVSEDDVIKAAGRLVGHGLGAEALAEILATMPSQPGQPLAAWVAQQDESLKQHEFQVEHIHHGVRAAMGQAALRVLAAEHLHQQSPAGGPAQPIQSGGETLDLEQGNPLSIQ